ncbi:hypothetical protein MAM1_0008c00905 [Mucor ambiguus]|uniref:Uncharacterized protein n=1 Tax=Mucor ambiguus TaxID=91626 RepID=A0A0C9MEM2_9FUNG|nr:hypothetical protein MAM1_0008c00905 [Mucor ambiguus]
MENINRDFVKRVLAAGQRNLAVRRANRAGYRFPVRIMKRRMIKNISNAAERMQRLFSRSPSPVPQQSTQNLSSQEDDDAIIPYDEETDLFNYNNAQNSAEYYNDTTTTTADATAADTNNDWWFEEENGEQLGPDNEEEELNSDDDNDEINSYISFSDVVTADDNLSFVDEIDTANNQNQENQQEVPASPSSAIGYSAGLAPIVEHDSFDTAENNNSTNHHQLVASTPDASNSQDNVSTVFNWLANLDPENLTRADIEQLLLTQTSELIFEDHARVSADADVNSSSSALIRTIEPVSVITHQVPYGNVSYQEPITDEVQHGNVSRQVVSNEMLYGEVPLDEFIDQVLHGDPAREENTYVMQHGEIRLQETTDEIPHGDVAGQIVTDGTLHSDVAREEPTHEILYGDASLQETTDEMLHGDAAGEEATYMIQHGDASYQAVANEMPYGNGPVEEISDEMLYGDIPLEEMTEEEHSSPESIDTVCISPPFVAATVIKDKPTWIDGSNAYAASVSSLAIESLLGKRKHGGEDNLTPNRKHQRSSPESVTTSSTSPPFLSATVIKDEFNWIDGSNAYATSVGSLAIKSSLGKRKHDDGDDLTLSTKHQKSSI